jgi:hypothetical protein
MELIGLRVYGQMSSCIDAALVGEDIYGDLYAGGQLNISIVIPSNNHPVDACWLHHGHGTTDNIGGKRLRNNRARETSQEQE